MSAILLIKVYSDKSILPVMADMIFERYKKGLYLHDLIWAFFESHDVYSLILISNRLKSSEQKDVELAGKLLGFIWNFEVSQKNNPKEQYFYAIRWIEENSPFLLFTGESLNQTKWFIPYKIIWDAKYICKRVSIDTGQILEDLDKVELKLLDKFNKLDNDKKVLLSNYSFRLHHKNIYIWHMWLTYPLAEQIRIAASGGLQ